MAAKGKSSKVKDGNSHLTIYPWVHPKTGRRAWRFGWKDGEKWKYKTCRTKDEAEIVAEKILQQQGKGLVWDGLATDEKKFLAEIHRSVSPYDRDAVLAFVKSRQSSADIETAVARFMAFKVAGKGRETEHLKQVRRDLEAAALHFKGRMMADIHTEDLLEWTALRAGKTAEARRHSLRGMITMLWNWGRLQGIVPNEKVTAADRLNPIFVPNGEKFVYTAEQLMKLAEVTDPMDRAWIVLQAFGSMRPEEVAPKSTSDKRGLLCENIDWDFGVVRVPDHVSKTVGSIVPLNDALRAWLEWAGIKKGMTGPVCTRNPSEIKETVRLGKLVFGADGWPADALRHSYGSYRNAILRNLPHLAEEMRTSVDMLNKHYHNPKAEIEGKIWFSMRPGVPICSDHSNVIYRDFKFVGGAAALQTVANTG